MTLFDALRQRFNEPDGKWLCVSDQVDVLNLIDVAEAAQAACRGTAGDGRIRSLSDALNALNRGDRRV